MSRADFLMVLYKLAGRPEWEGDKSFNDVLEGAYYYDAVMWAANIGLVVGDGSGNFGLGPVSRQEMAIILEKYAVHAGHEINKLRDMPEGLIYSDWSDEEGYITSLAEAGLLTSGGEDLTENATRGEIAQMFKDFIRFIVEAQ
jgi:hypothetical protein